MVHPPFPYWAQQGLRMVVCSTMVFLISPSKNVFIDDIFLAVTDFTVLAMHIYDGFIYPLAMTKLNNSSNRQV